jgi:tRNA threonylcarbamoyladenosine biosynthesis protein TsaB
MLLAFEASSQLGGVAFIKDDSSLCFEEISSQPKSHSELIHPMTKKVLAVAGAHLSQIDAYAIGVGPGSFTGIRVAANTALAFAQAFSKPIILVDTLEQLASMQSPSAMPVLVLLNAFRNLYYAAIYLVSKNELSLLQEPTVLNAQKVVGLVQAHNQVRVVGDGWRLLQTTLLLSLDETIQKKFCRESTVVDMTSPAALAKIAVKKYQRGLVFHWKEYSPLYLRASEAEEKWGEVHAHGKNKS